jgi:hypothetical protein
MIKKICIALGIVTVVFLILALVVKMNTKVPYFYNSDQDSTFVCPQSFLAPFQDMSSLRHDKPYHVGGEGVCAETRCSFSPFYFLFADIYIISFTLLLMLIYWNFLIKPYKKYIKKNGIIKKIGFWFIILIFSWFMYNFISSIVFFLLFISEIFNFFLT